MPDKKKDNLVHLSSYVTEEELSKIKKKAGQEILSTSRLVRKLVSAEIKRMKSTKRL